MATRTTYPMAVQERIRRALARAADMNQRAWALGTRQSDGARVFTVRSKTYPKDLHVAYIQYAHARPLPGAFRYGDAPWWIACNCMAGGEFSRPCAHAARVALRLEREHDAGMRNALRSVRPRGGELFEGDEHGPGGGQPFTAREGGSSGGRKLEDYFAA